jgi:hypothetical protein
MEMTDNAVRQALRTRGPAEARSLDIVFSAFCTGHLVPLPRKSGLSWSCRNGSLLNQRPPNVARTQKACARTLWLASLPWRSPRFFQGALPMPPTYVLARDHLQRAATILQGVDSRSRQLRYIIERTISLMDETRQEPRSRATNVLDFAAFRENRVGVE